MAHPLKQYVESDDFLIEGMVTHAAKAFPYLEMSSKEAMISLAKLMIHSMFVRDSKPTPIRASYDFLRALVENPVDGSQPKEALFSHRDMVFAIKMFGLRIRVTKGLMQFVPDNKFDDQEDEEFIIDGEKSAKTLEFYLSDVQKRTKIQIHAIESAFNKLIREWREYQLSELVANKVNFDKWSIGEVRDFLRKNCQVKDHEFVRIRAKAIDSGRLQSRRNPSQINRRISLDEDVVEYVSEMGRKLGGRTPFTATKTVNRIIRDFKTMMEAAGSPGGKKVTRG